MATKASGDRPKSTADDSHRTTRDDSSKLLTRISGRLDNETHQEKVYGKKEASLPQAHPHTCNLDVNEPDSDPG